MQVAKLSADLSFRSLVTADDDTAGKALHLLANEGPIGDRWISPRANYFEETRHPYEDCCEAELTAQELGTTSEANATVGDCPHFWGINCGVLTERAFAALHDLLRPYVEFLPIVGPGEQFIAFKVLRFVDALDREESTIEWFPQLKMDFGKPHIAREIKRFAFHEDRLTDETIFCIPEMPFCSNMFVTERFIRAVENYRLTGFQFTEVWPPADPRQRAIEEWSSRRKQSSK